MNAVDSFSEWAFVGKERRLTAAAKNARKIAALYVTLIRALRQPDIVRAFTIRKLAPSDQRSGHTDLADGQRHLRGPGIATTFAAS
jgi:hypothetical protein